MTREIITQRRPDTSGGLIDPDLADAITRACEDRAGRPLAGGRELRFQCPAPGHADRHPSARWHMDKQVWRCDACGAAGGAIDLARLLGLPLGGPSPQRGGFPSPQPPPHLGSSLRSSPDGEGELVRAGGGAGPGRIVATYPYGERRRVVRYEPKTFRPQHLVDGRWQPGRGPDAWPLYWQDGLPGDRSVAVHVTEGEKDADALTGLGWHAVSPGSSATPWRPEWTALLAGRPVVVHADHDAPGEKRAEEIARTLAPVAAPVRVVRYRELPAGGDVSDFLADHDGEELRARVAATPPWTAEQTPPPAPPRLSSSCLLTARRGEQTAVSGTGDLNENRFRPGPESGRDATSGPLLPDAPLPETAPAFPLAVLPPGVRAYVGRAAASLSVPPEMIAVPLLALAGSLAGNRLRLVLKAGFEVLPALWVAVVAPPGSAKTPALGFARHGLEARQRAAYAQWEYESDSYEAQLRAWGATREGDRGPEPRRPRLRHYWTANTTTEALAGTLTQAHGVALVADELSGWIAGMDQYRSGKGADRQTFLSLWSGVSTKIDRKSQPPVLIEQPVVGIAGGIQDDLVATLHDARQRRDGLIERFLFVRPETEPGFWTEDDVPPALLAELERVFMAIDGLPARVGAPAAGSSSGGVAGDWSGAVRFHPEARAVWRGWFDDNTEWVRESSGLERGFASKWPVQTARLALVLHLLWAASEGSDPLRMMSAERLDRAIELADWFRMHLSRVLPLFAPVPPDSAPLASGSSPTPDTARERIVRLLRRYDGQWVSRSQLMLGLRTIPTDRLQGELAQLEAAGIAERRVLPTGTRSREDWRLAPPPPP